MLIKYIWAYIFIYTDVLNIHTQFLQKWCLTWNRFSFLTALKEKQELIQEVCGYHLFQSCAHNLAQAQDKLGLGWS